MMAFRPPNKTPTQKEAPPLAITWKEEAVRVAFESVHGKRNVEGCPPIYTNLAFCKSILHEYAVKTKMELEYKTKLKPGFLPRFVSSVNFNGKEYMGEEATSKKEAEQLAAQAAIKSLLEHGSDSRSLALIIMSKEIKFGQVVPYTVAQVPPPALILPSTRQGRLVHVPSLGPLTGGQDKRGKSFKKQRAALADNTLLSHSTEPRRSNRMRKPTTKLRESLESQSNYNDSIDFS